MFVVELNALSGGCQRHSVHRGNTCAIVFNTPAAPVVRD